MTDSNEPTEADPPTAPDDGGGDASDLDATDLDATTGDAASADVDDASGSADTGFDADDTNPDGELGDIAIEVEVEPDDALPELDPAAERIGQLEAELAEVTKQKDDNWERLLRSTADIDNLRKRSRREVEDARTESRSSVLKEMLPVIDNLERAVQHAESQGDGSQDAHGMVEGVKLVLRQFAQALERCEVTAVEDVGTPFDPNVHEAISQSPTSEYPPGTVCQSLQRGYKIGKRLLRPALVVVATAPPEAEAEAEAESESESESETETETETGPETQSDTGPDESAIDQPPDAADADSEAATDPEEAV